MRVRDLGLTGATMDALLNSSDVLLTLLSWVVSQVDTLIPILRLLSPLAGRIAWIDPGLIEQLLTLALVVMLGYRLARLAGDVLLDNTET